jgi:hypothetical protein
MKVLRRAPEDQVWSKKVICTGWGHTNQGCGAKLKVYQEDLQRELPTAQKDTGAVTYTCVCCAARNDIGVSFWPADYKSLKIYSGGGV